MTSEEFESTSSSLGQGSSSTQSSGGGGSTNEMRRESGHGVSTERRRRRRATVTFTNDAPPRCRARTVTKRAVFRTQSIDPEVDRAIVADAVHFVVSASSKGCVSLVSSFAEHLKYKISLEEKLVSVTRELQSLRLKVQQHRCPHVPVTVHESTTSQLTKQPSVEETKVERYDTNFEMLLPGAVPHESFNTSNQQNYLKHPSTTITTAVSDFKHEGINKENMTGSPQISRNVSSSAQKSCIDSETQTPGSLRKPLMIDRGCSPMPEDKINSVLLEQQYPKPQERVKNGRDVTTQTHFEIMPRKPKLTERRCSPDIVETVTQLQQRPKKSDKDKIYSPTSNKKHECTTQKSDFRHLPAVPKSRPSSAISVTNHSAKSFPGVKNCMHDKVLAQHALRKKRCEKMKK